MKLKVLLNELFVNKNDNTKIQFFRYIFVGATAFLVDFFFLFILTDILDLQYLISAAIAFLLGLITNYLLSIFWVFKNRKISKRINEFIVFALIGIGGLLLNEFIIWFFTDIASLYYLVSKIISTIMVLCYNFFLRKKILF